jgi:hypothetical protein
VNGPFPSATDFFLCLVWSIYSVFPKLFRFLKTEGVATSRLPGFERERVPPVAVNRAQHARMTDLSIQNAGFGRPDFVFVAFLPSEGRFCV